MEKQGRLREFYSINQIQMWTRGEWVRKNIENLVDVIRMLPKGASLYDIRTQEGGGHGKGD